MQKKKIMHFFLLKKIPIETLRDTWRKWAFAPIQQKKRKKKKAICPCFQTNQGHVPILVLDNPIVELCKKLDYTEVKYP